MGSVAPDWLSRLAPPHASLPASWWPPAPGWWALLVILLVLIAVFFYWQRMTRLSRIALIELEKLETFDAPVLAQELEHLLRRYAIARFGRETVAMLCGERWIEFVIDHGGTAWRGEAGSHFLRAAYGGVASAHRDAWLSGAKAFIRRRS